jgi:3'-phosphoadenosine 5'-phosphosulfate sulfotransferase (PAPS reductase)/FAD synthetase
MYSLRFALCGFQRAGALRTEYLPLFSKGDDSGGDTPLPIPNREVKPASADGTAGETPWESRSSPISHSAAHSFRDSASRRRRNALSWPDTSFGRNTTPNGVSYWSEDRAPWVTNQRQEMGAVR